MSPRIAKRLEDALGVLLLGMLLWLIWGWWSFSGPYRLIARLELKVFGAFGAVSTFALGAFIIGLVATFASRPLSRIRLASKPQLPRRSPAEAKLIAERALSKFLLVAGSMGLAVTLFGAVGLFNESHRSKAITTLDLSTPRELPPDAALIRLIGYTRAPLTVGVEIKESTHLSTEHQAFMAVVGPSWKRGDRVPVIVQGSPALGLSTRHDGSSSPEDPVPVLLPIAVRVSTTSGFASDLLADHGAIVDSHTVILDTDLGGVHQRLLNLVMIGGLSGLVGVGIGLFGIRRQ